MDNLAKLIKEGKNCAMYTHKEDISKVLRFIQMTSPKKYKIDNKSYYSVLNKRRTTTGIFVVLKEKKIKFTDKPDKVKDYHLFIYKMRGGEFNA